MTFAISIGGTLHDIEQSSLQISKTTNGRSTALFTVVSVDASYRTQLDEDVRITNVSGGIEFAGYVDRVSEKDPTDGSFAIALEINCGDYQGYADRVTATGDRPAETLKARLQFLAAYMAAAPMSVTLDGAQVDGPTVPALTYQDVQVSQALSDLATYTASAGEPYLWKISDLKVLGMYQASTVTAPFNITPADTNALQDIQVEQRRQDFANRVIVTVPPKQEAGHVETFPGDGVTSTFQLQWTLTKSPGIIHVFESDGVTPAGGETFGIPPDSPIQWSYSPLNNQITRLIGPTDPTKVYKLIFDATYTARGIAEDAGSIAAIGPYEKVVQLDAVPTDQTADDIAAGILAAFNAINETITYTTLQMGLDVGMTQTVTVPKRNIDTTAVISDINITDFEGRFLIYEITAILDTSQTNAKKGWRDSIRQAWTVGGGAGTSVTVGSTTASIGPASPNKAVQFNRSGAFGGKESFIFYEDQNSLAMGGGGTAITATDFESCLALGYGCAIEDA